MRSTRLLVVILTFLTSISAPAAEFHVRPSGSSKGNGSLDQPWDLATALQAADTVKPGDTVWLHAGTYQGGFISRLKGTRDKPIVVSGFRGERVTIDARPRDERDNALFLLQGADAIYRDFEVTCSDPLRKTAIAGSWPADIRRGNVDVRGDRISLVNLVIHDCASGVGLWAEGESGEVSGCLIYNNGWAGPDRSHGHAIYAQNARGTKRIVDNIVFNQFGYGIHVYGSEKASLKGFEIDRNIAFGNGSLSGTGDSAPGIMVGGASPAERIAVRDNIVTGGGIRLGYPWGVVSEDVLCTGNYCEGLVVRDFRRATVSKNTIVAHSNVVQMEGAEKLLLGGVKWNNNELFVTDGRWGEAAIVENGKSRGMSIEEWRRATGCDTDSRFTKGTPKELRVTVRPNAHQKGRAQIAVINPESLPQVDIDLSKVLSNGQKYRVASVKNFYGPPVITGVADGKPVTIPLQPVTAAAPVGMKASDVPVTEPQFAAFVVLPEE
ncbi:MAG: right-handed parallel beta-helix repeat-containing protein [Planctomycetaceae bacterium]|nr:right-handed parallel beta-helix repeat-containing protein [Planctomycetaceae bacterium]